MKLYGYSSAQINDYGLLSLREVTFVASPDVLRNVATFLTTCAEMLERGEFRHTHLHIEEIMHGWKYRASDVIVGLPRDEDLRDE